MFVSVLGSESEKQATFDGLDSVRIAPALARWPRAALRVAPEIQFKEDDTIARAARIESLLSEIRDTPSSSSPVGSEPSGEVPASPEAGDGSGEA